MILQNILVVSLVLLCGATDILAVIWPCQNNHDCKTLNINATCSNCGKCVCPPGKVYSTSTITCVDSLLFGEKCNESVQCSLMPTGLDCIEGECRCKEGNTYIHGQCKKLSRLGEKCDQNLDCWFGYNRQSVICSKGYCTCAKGYYERHSEICRHRASESEPCVVHTDCDTQKCVNFLCVTNKTDGKIPLPKLSSVDYDFKLLSLKTLSINKDYSFNNKNFQYEGVSKKFGESCTKIAQQCEGLNHSICVENVCYCQQGYYPEPTTKICMAELGEPASPTTCGHEIISDLCTCKKNFNYDDNLRTCRKSIVFTAPCTADNQCSVYAAYCKLDKPRKCICPPFFEYDTEQQLCITKQGLGTPCKENDNCAINNAICSKDKICICKDKYYEVNGTCLAGIGANCTDNQDCKIENAICSKKDIDDKNKSCICHNDFVHFLNRCLKKALHIEDECVEKKQCDTMLANCIENKCICAENQHYSHGKCELKKYIGQSCSRMGECFVPSNQKSVECRNSVCACKDKYLMDFDGTTCVNSANNSSRQHQSMLDIFTIFFCIYSMTVINHL